MDALAALGNYEDGSDSGSDDIMECQPSGAAAAAAAATAAASASAVLAARNALQTSLLPDASGLGLPDSWTSHGGEDCDSSAEPAHDPKGTRYNTVQLPASLANAGASSKLGRTTHKPAAIPIFPAGASDAASLAAPAAKRQAVASAPAPRRAVGGQRQLLPPQLRRPNVVTEDSKAWSSTAKPRRNS